MTTPRSTLAAWGGQTGAQLMPLYDAHRAFVLGCRVLHADETPIALLDPGAGRTKKAYMWAYARGAYERERGVVFDFCPGRGGQYLAEFLRGWSGTLVVDAYSGYDRVLSIGGRHTAFCVAHARRKFDELFKANASPVAAEAIQRMAMLYKIEADARALSSEDRLRTRQERSRPLWEHLHRWLQLERTRVPEGSAIAKAIDYSLNHWAGLGRFLLDGDVPIDNNHCENLIRPWALGRRNWLFIGQPAGRRASRGRDEPAAVGNTQWARSLRLPEGRAHAAADAVEQSDRGNCCRTAGNGPAEGRQAEPLRVVDDVTARLHIEATRTPAQSHRRNRGTITLRASANTFSMNAMVGFHSRQLKMPRPAAYQTLSNLNPKSRQCTQ